MTDQRIDVSKEVAGICAAFDVAPTAVAAIYISPAEVVLSAYQLSEDGRKMIDPDGTSKMVGMSKKAITA